MTDLEEIWRQKSDQELAEGARHLAEYTQEGQRVIRAELRRRGLAEPPDDEGQVRQLTPEWRETSEGGKTAMSRLERELRALFRDPFAAGMTALLASLVGGIAILVFLGPSSLLTAAAVYAACGIVVYFHHRETRWGFEPGLSTFTIMIIVWPFAAAAHAWEVMEYWNARDRFRVFVARQETATDKQGLDRFNQELGRFRHWRETLDCAEQKAKELSKTVWISCRPGRGYLYSVDPAGRLERHKVPSVLG